MQRVVAEALQQPRCQADCQKRDGEDSRLFGSAEMWADRTAPYRHASIARSCDWSVAVYLPGSGEELQLGRSHRLKHS